MVKFKRAGPQKLLAILANMRDMLFHHDHGWGIVCLLAAIVVLSLVAGLQRTSNGGIFLAGEIASRNIAADRDLVVEDYQATKARRDQVMAEQPMIFDLDQESIVSFRAEVLDTLEQIARTGDLSAFVTVFNQTHGSMISQESLRLLANADAQAHILHSVLPGLEVWLNDGVVEDASLLPRVQESLLVRDVSTGREVLREIRDVPSLLTAVSQDLRTGSRLPLETQNAIRDLMFCLIRPSLILNQDAVSQRDAELLRAIEPVYYHLQRGEMVVRAGDKVSHEQQIKMQSLFGQSERGLDPGLALGVFILSLMLTLGLFMTPSGTKGTVLHTRDQAFLALLLAFFGLAAWGVSCLTANAGFVNSPAPAFAFPVAGGAGLAALIFSAKRYCAVGLLLSMFATIMFQGSLGLFLFYFLSAMFNTWLVMHSQNRQDAVWSGIPLMIWILLSGLAAAWVGGGNGNWLYVLLAMFVNSLLSVLLLFALSPILEATMGFTTRFRLMELMNLQQPLLQHLMMSTPGTYHHSLLVSYLGEAGAAAVGANSLLCKVGALYHDIGKLSRPDYFVENQFGGPNPHDKLSPSMSALVLGSHVKHGVELAAENKLGRELTDIIAQHHGTRAIMFFYQKALALGENPRLEDYSYPGPRPQSKEAAIIMIADAVEASSRTLGDPTPARIKAHVDTIIKNIYAEGQLDESDLAFKDISKLTDSFVRILTGLFHKRISYPDKAGPRPGPQFPSLPEPEDLDHKDNNPTRRESLREHWTRCRQQGQLARYLNSSGQK